MNLNQAFNEIREYIKRAKVNEALMVLDNVIQFGYPNQYDKFILLSYRYYQIETDNRDGLIAKDNISSNRINVITSILAFIKAIESDSKSI